MNLVKTLTLLATTGFLAEPAYSQILTVGANCVNRQNKNQILSVFFDSTSRRLIAYMQDTSDEYAHDSLYSEPITTPPRFEDKDNPIKIKSRYNFKISNVQFTTKGGVAVSNSQGTRVYGCQAYFPGQLGMRYL